jgi:hypothetical protein
MKDAVYYDERSDCWFETGPGDTELPEHAETMEEKADPIAVGGSEGMYIEVPRIRLLPVCDLKETEVRGPVQTRISRSSATPVDRYQVFL